MGIIGQILGGGARDLTRAVGNVADGFRPNATRRLQLGHDAYIAALDQHGTEFEHGRAGWFDSAMNGFNRLPRPMLALGTIGLFVYAMTDPAGFAPRMQGLALVPDPLWWLLGAIVSFYFGARELHYARHRKPPGLALGQTKRPPQISGDNPALKAWRASRGG